MVQWYDSQLQGSRFNPELKLLSVFRLPWMSVWFPHGRLAQINICTWCPEIALHPLQEVFPYILTLC